MWTATVYIFTRIELLQAEKLHCTAGIMFVFKWSFTKKILYILIFFFFIYMPTSAFVFKIFFLICSTYAYLLFNFENLIIFKWNFSHVEI